MLRGFLLAAAVAVSGSALAQTVTDDTAKNVSSETFAAMNAAFGERLSDPTSVQFRKLKVFTPAGANYEAVCGEFNAKNKLGGYAGFEPFQYLPPSKQITNAPTSCLF